MTGPSRRGRLSRRAVLAGVPALAGAAALGPGPAATAAEPDAARRALPVRGADISFTLQEEAAGTTYRRGGVAAPVERILAGYGASHVRLRVWVDPPAGYSDLADALILARRARRAGLRLLLDLHYADFWADPGHQPTPAAWQALDLPGLVRTVHRYTRDVVAAFADQGTPLAMVAIGNEITNGMLWPLGQVYRSDGEHWAPLAELLRAGVAGVRDAGRRPGGRPLTMIHIDRGGDNAGSRYFFDHILAERVRFDLIGQSYYPFWHGPLAALRANLGDLAARYGKDIVVAETAYPWTTGNGDALANSFTSADQLPDAAAFPPTRAGQAAYFEALRQVIAQVPGGHGAGFFDWEPEWVPGVGWEPGAGNPNDNLTMFDWTGEALPSMRAFRRPARTTS
ncbi:MAG TPA: glycosyl hydrolase 53 family protein [Mycobacteriales bacterium]